MTDQKPTQELLRASASGTVLTSPAEYAAYLNQARSRGAHVLSPVTDIGSLPEHWVFVPSAVYINPDEAAGEVYRDSLFCKGEEVALTKIALRKIAKAAGISWTVSREDSGTVANYWAMKCELSYRGHDGLPKTEEASYEWDLRDDSPRLKKFKDGQEGKMSAPELNRARLTGYRRCEAGAINAAIREYGLKQKYTRTELARPFVVFNLVFVPQTEEQKNMLAQAALGGSSLLYGGGTMALPAVSHATGEIVDQFTGKEPEPKTAAAPKERSFDDIEADEAKAGGCLVTGVTNAEGTDDYFVTLEDGRRLHTADRSVAKACNDARREKTRILIETDQLEIVEVGGGKY